MEISFTDKLTLREASCIFLLQSTNERDEPVYAYVLVSGDALPMFKQAIAKPEFEPAKFGTVLLSNTGQPSEADRQMMETQHGFNHADMQPIAL